MSKEITKTFVINDHPYTKIDEVIQPAVEGSLKGKLTRSKLRAIFQHGCVMINGKICYNPGTKLKKSDTASVTFNKDLPYKELPKKAIPVGFTVVYEDGHLLVVNKEAGVVTVPNATEQDNTLLDYIEDYLPKNQRPEIVHRLDRETSGLLVFAKSIGACRKLKSQFEERKPLRAYFAIVHGKVENPSGTFDTFISVDDDLNQYSVKTEGEGKRAITHYEVVKILPEATLVKVILETGRRNQIRVHFSESGHPVLGDKRYGKQSLKTARWEDENLALHAATLGFTHPTSKKKMYFESEMPIRMAEYARLKRKT